MPLSTVCVSSLKSRQRLCASDSNILEDIRNMNDTDLTRFKETNDSYYSPTLSRRLLGYGYELPDKSPSRKEKKWSIGSLFRRKKKDNVDNNSSSEEDASKKGFLGRKKRKPESKKKKPKPVGTFDHVVMPRNVYNNGVLERDSSGYFNSYAGKPLPKTPQENNNIKRMGRYITDPLDEVNNSSLVSLGSASTDSSTRKNRKGLVMIRAEARRVTLRNDTSSDEDSVSSSKFRSDESLSSLHRKSRAARTERYLRRYSKDGEKSILRPSKSDAENFNVRISDDSNRSLSRSPLVPTNTSFLSLTTPSLSGLLTIPPSHGSHSRIRVNSNSVSKPQKPEINGKEFSNQRSVSCDGNIHKETKEAVQHVPFPLKRPNVRFRNLSLIDPYRAHPRQPPPPPPRDPKRLIHYDNGRPNTYYHDDTKKSQSFSCEANRKIHPREFSSFNLHPNGRSTSEDYLSYGPKLSQELRPSSATPEASHRSFLQRHLEMKSNPDNYQYLTDKKPRSRKPIFIETNNNNNNRRDKDKSETQKALDFWRQRERSDDNQKPNVQSPTQPKSPQMFTCKTMVQTQVFLPSVLQNDINSNNLIGTDTVDGSEFRHPDVESLANGLQDTISPNVNGLPNGRPNVNSPVRNALPNARLNESPGKETDLRETPEDDFKRKSSNLEEALDELEAIYNSLRLGDEDLLERAEEREREAQQLKHGWNFSRGTLSDSSFNYEPFDSVDSPRRKRLLKKSQTVDRRTDDMAYRKMNKERSSTICDPQSVISTVSYLQASPIYADDVAPLVNQNSNSKEPDVMLDDVVYRNVKYVNSVPKVIEPQPPFGIPLGPMTPASNSDYLHAVPENETKRIIRNKIPDVVKDDLAFRNLRKDGSKEPALPVSDAAKVAKASKLDWSSLKKRRAVRSMSANIGCLMNGNSAKDLNKYDDIDSELTDIANAMDVSRQILKEKDNNITETRRGFLSDTDASNGNNKYAESRMNFLNSLRESNENSLHAKPPRGSTPERKSPRSVRESTPIYISPYEEKRLGRRADSPYDDLLNNLAAKTEETTQLIDNEIKQLEKDERNGFSKVLSDIDAVSEQAKLCEKLLESVVSSDFVPSPVEEVEQIPEPAVANVVMTRGDCVKNISEKAALESDHDYENLASDRDLSINEAMDDREEMATTPFEEHKAELIATFQELKDSTKDDSSEVTGEERVTPQSASNLRECACMSPPPNTSNNCDNVTCSNSTESDSQSSGFHSNDDATQLCSFASLKSPRLVLETFRRSSQEGGGGGPAMGRSNGCNARGYYGQPDRPEGKNDAWYRDPATLAVACSYGIACAHQIVALDVVAILGILFAVLSFIAALFF